MEKRTMVQLVSEKTTKRRATSAAVLHFNGLMNLEEMRLIRVSRARKRRTPPTKYQRILSMYPSCCR